MNTDELKALVARLESEAERMARENGEPLAPISAVAGIDDSIAAVNALPELLAEINRLNSELRKAKSRARDAAEEIDEMSRMRGSRYYGE